jgi:HAD superfamily hydrolase (TIGR01484 family)
MIPPHLLLACDLDGTLIPFDPRESQGHALADLAIAIAGRPNTLLAYVTGRYYSLAVDGIGAHNLPKPDALVCDVGTSTYFRTAGSDYELDPEYSRQMVRAFGGLEQSAIRRSLDGISGLDLQEEEKQGRFKVSYYLPADADHEPLLTEVRHRLERIGATTNTVYSIDPSNGAGLVDVLPASVSKGSAVQFLCDRTGTPRDRVVYAGDSGNDSEALLSGFKAIVVGNAPDSFKAELRRSASEADLLSHLYFADGRHAAGVLEGCRHFGFL